MAENDFETIVAPDSLDRTMSAARTLVELVSADFGRVDRLRIAIEKQAATMIGYTGAQSTMPTPE